MSLGDMAWLENSQRLGDVIGRHGVAGEAPGGDHDIIALLPQSGRTDTVHLSPDVVPVQIVPLKVPQGRHVLVEDINLVEAAGLDRGGDMTSLGTKLEDLRVNRDVELYEVLDDLVRGLPLRVGQLALNLLELCHELICAQTS